MSHARTGSTLLRYIIDTHPELCCPPEVALGQLCVALSYTITLTGVHEAVDSSESEGKSLDYAAVRLHSALRAHGIVRAHVDQIMDAYCAATNKRRWCDKSSNNVQHLNVLGRIFPDGQYICLHRNCLDVVHSLINLFRLSFPGHYGELVVAARGNIVDAMIDSWIEATQSLLEFEAANPSLCFRVKYEELVADPVDVVGGIFSFLDEAFDARMLDRVFSTPHDPGPGDLKIQYTSEILGNRHGRGRYIPRNQISEDRLVKLNVLHEQLGFAKVTREETSPSASIAAFESAMQSGTVSMPIAANRWA